MNVKAQNPKFLKFELWIWFGILTLTFDIAFIIQSPKT